MHSIAQMRRKSMSELHKTITHTDSSEPAPASLNDHISADLSKPIPHIEFPFGFLTVEDPSDEPLVYLDDEFECDSDYYHWKEIGGKPLPGSSPSIMPWQWIPAIASFMTIDATAADALVPSSFPPLVSHIDRQYLSDVLLALNTGPADVVLNHQMLCRTRRCLWNNYTTRMYNYS